MTGTHELYERLRREMGIRTKTKRSHIELIADVNSIQSICDDMSSEGNTPRESEPEINIFDLEELMLPSQLSKLKSVTSEEPKRIPGESGVRKEVYEGKNLRRVAWGETYNGQPTDRSLRFHRQNRSIRDMPEERVEVDLTPLSELVVGDNSNIPIKFTRANGTYVKIKEAQQNLFGKPKPIKEKFCTQLYKRDASLEDASDSELHSDGQYDSMEDVMMEISPMERRLTSTEPKPARNHIKKRHTSTSFWRIGKSERRDGYGCSTSRETCDHRQKRMLEYRDGVLQTQAAIDKSTMQDGGDELVFSTPNEISLDSTVFALIDSLNLKDHHYDILKDAIVNVAEKQEKSFFEAGEETLHSILKLYQKEHTSVVSAVGQYFSLPAQPL